MMEYRQIVRLWKQGEASVLVTLVRAEGSSYRKPGARLLLTERGEYAGTISGGCLESEVIHKAAWMVRQGARVERYSTVFDDTADIPFGLGCGGIVDLLFEPATTPECAALIKAVEDSLAGQNSSVVTWLPDDGKALRRVVLVDGEVTFASQDFSERKLQCAFNLRAGSEYEGRFVEEIRGPQRLFVFGAGDDAKPLVNMATLLGWRVVVADGRAQLAKADRFRLAESVVVGGVEGLGVSPADAVVVMTHSYEQDREVLSMLLPIAPRYLGVLGARHRSSLLVNEAAVKTGFSVAECCNRIYAPVGLDLGGDGPEAIALAVLAEAQAACQGRLGASRRLTAEDVARYLAEGSAARYLQHNCTLETSL
jgi:xanthine dehydrogenase accessory factor